MRLARSRWLRSVPKKTGTTAQSLAGSAPALAGGAGMGAADLVVGRVAPSPAPPLVASSLLALAPGGSGGGAGDATAGDGGVGDAEGSEVVGAEGGGDAGAEEGGAAARRMANVSFLASEPVGGGDGAAVLGAGATARGVGADTTGGGDLTPGAGLGADGGAMSLAKAGRL